ncbi:hypothetical protein Tco_1009972 [Tanacetum coccineum]
MELGFVDLVACDEVNLNVIVCLVVIGSLGEWMLVEGDVVIGCVGRGCWLVNAAFIGGAGFCVWLGWLGCGGLGCLSRGCGFGGLLFLNKDCVEVGSGSVLDDGASWSMEVDIGESAKTTARRATTS